MVLIDHVYRNAGGMSIAPTLFDFMGLETFFRNVPGDDTPFRYLLIDDLTSATSSVFSFLNLEPDEFFFSVLLGVDIGPLSSSLPSVSIEILLAIDSSSDPPRLFNRLSLESDDEFDMVLYRRTGFAFVLGEGGISSSLNGDFGVVVSVL